MPKNQNLSIAQNRINGVCGQIKCCMKYEDDVYTQKKKLPKEGSYVQLLNGDKGKVLKHHIIKEQFDLLTDKGTIKRYSSNVYSHSKSAPPKDWRFPKEFNLITNETNEVISWEVNYHKRDESNENFNQKSEHPASNKQKMENNREELESKSEERQSDNTHKNKSQKRRRGNRNRPRNKSKNHD